MLQMVIIVAYLLLPANKVCKGHVFTGVCLSTGGMHGRGACMGVCMAGGMFGGHAWQGACVTGGVCVAGVCMPCTPWQIL